MKSMLRVRALLVLSFLCSCGGGGDGVPDYSGIWHVEGSLTSNGCRKYISNPRKSLSYDLRVDQDGKSIVVYDGVNTFIGSTDGNT